MRRGDVSSPQIEVERVRIGMDIHVDGGWLSHPFARSRFVVTTPDQLLALRRSGVRSVRWFPSSSRDTAVPAEPTAPAPASMPERPGPADADADAPSSGRLRRLAATPLPAGARRFKAAIDAHARIVTQVHTEPLAAAALAADTVRQVLDDLLADDDHCIQLLPAVLGDAESTHAVNVAVVSLLMGRHLGFDETELIDLGVGALLHDLGKADLPHAAHHLGQGDDTLYRSHVLRGVAFAKAMGLSDGACQVVAQHHEQLDGGGFPSQLRSEHLSAPSRVVALVNRFDKLCNPRRRGDACSPHEALARLFQQHQGRFDTAILSSFIKMIGVYPPGSTVQLTDNRYALVTSMHSLRPLKPTVLPYDRGAKRATAAHLDLTHATGIGVLRSVPAQALPAEVHEFLQPPERIAYSFEPSAAMPLAA